MPPHSPRSAARPRPVLVALLAALVLLAAAGGLKASSFRLPAVPVQTPAAPYNALLPIVAGRVASPTPSATWTSSPTATAPPAPSSTATPSATHTPTLPALTSTRTPTTAAPPVNTPAPAQVDAQALYDALFRPALAEDPISSGSVANCIPGALSAARLAALEKQVNYFRQMAGVPPITFDPVMNARAQAAALIMAAQGNLSHAPPTDWKCYSEEGAVGASKSNLGISYGYDTHFTVMNFMEDRGDNNLAVGHREWLLAPPTTHMGGGEIKGPEWDAYAIYVVDPDASYYGLWPATREEFVAWPPPGYVPRTVAYARWSFFLPDADFAVATVEMHLNGSPVSVIVIYKETVGSARALANWNGLVWEPNLDLHGLDWSTPQRVQVAVRNVQQAGGAMHDFTYELMLFEPTP